MINRFRLTKDREKKIKKRKNKKYITNISQNLSIMFLIFSWSE